MCLLEKVVNHSAYLSSLLNIEGIKDVKGMFILWIIDFFQEILGIFHAFPGSTLGGRSNILVKIEIRAHLVGHARHAAQFGN